MTTCSLLCPRDCDNYCQIQRHQEILRMKTGDYAKLNAMREERQQAEFYADYWRTKIENHLMFTKEVKK